MQVIVHHRDQSTSIFPLDSSNDGFFFTSRKDIAVGDHYTYQIEDREPLPDPASRFQPNGPHGPSEVIDAALFSWTDAGWKGISMEKLVIYELHVGTFSKKGNYEGVMDRLVWLADLGVTAIELMPLAEWSGSRNWGYDGVHLFAPFHHYGQPDDLRRLVDRAHAVGLAVILDVVFNHLGSDGNYLPKFSPHYFTDRHSTCWGSALNFDGPYCEPVREFFIENALHWVHEYRVDGLRLDATHAILDDSSQHFLAELSTRVSQSSLDREVLLIAEDHRNLKQMLLPASSGGWGLDGVWADDFHHQVRRRLAGDHESYYRDFTGSIEDLAKTMRQGWFYCGQFSVHNDEFRGTDPTGVPLQRFVHCIQNHDQIGNRAMGERLNHQIDLCAYRAASTLLLTAPATPLLFMGQEWGASTPFLFFTDHEPELGKQVTEGRRREFGDFSSFTDPQQREEIPDPQAETTFLASRLNWEELSVPEHSALLRLYRCLLTLRQSEPLLNAAHAVATQVDSFRNGKDGQPRFLVKALDQATLGIIRSNHTNSQLLILVHLADPNVANCGPGSGVETRELVDPSISLDWNILLTTEDAQFAGDPKFVEVNLSGSAPVVTFLRSAAVLLKGFIR